MSHRHQRFLLQMAGVAGFLAIASPATPPRTVTLAGLKPFMNPRVNVAKPKSGIDIWVEVSPGEAVVTPNSSVEVQIHFCATGEELEGTQGNWTYTVTLNGEAVNTGSWSIYPRGQDGCELWIGNVTIADHPEQQTLYAALNTNSYGGASSSAIFLIPEKYRAAVVAPATSNQGVIVSSSNVQSFTIYNTGEAAGEFMLDKECTGSGFSGSCTLSSTSVHVGPDSSATVTVSYTASATAGTTGTITVTATDTLTMNTHPVSGTTDVTVISAPSAGVVLARSLGTVRRSDCVVARLGSSSAMECGDLRIDHTLPSTRVMDRVRTPTLLYHSQHARPTPVVLADVTIPSGALPDSVQATVYVNSSANATASWPASQWGSGGSTRRIAIPIDASALSTSLYDYYVSVAYRTSGSTVGTATSATEKLAIIDRSASPYGAGWSLGGVEEIKVVSSTLLWIGGDGSTTVYSSVATNQWVGTRYDVPDTIVFETGPQEYVRRGPGGDFAARFDAAGRHTSTLYMGKRTTYHYDGASNRVDTISYETPTVPKRYALKYSSGQLDSVIAPQGDASTARKVVVFHTGARVDSIRDPDVDLVRRVKFTYGSGSNSNRIASRIDRLGHSTTFTYDGANGVATSTIEMGGGAAPDIVTTVRPAESEGVAGSAYALDSAYTRIDGPRTDVADVTRIWVNRFGAAVKARDAMGGENYLTYSTDWPGLVVSARSPSRMVTNAFYASSTGLLDSMTAVNPLGNASNATTRYAWNTTWRSATSIQPPVGPTVTMSYDNGTGTRSWEQVGSDSARRVRYFYDGNRQLTRIKPPLTDTIRLSYDSLGNTAGTTSARGLLTWHYNNGIGQDTLTATATDTSLAGSTSDLLSYGQLTRTWYDPAGRVTETRTRGRGLIIGSDTVRDDSLRVINTYDRESHVTETVRQYQHRLVDDPLTGTREDLISPQTASLSNTWVYDWAGRVKQETSAGAAGMNTYKRDPAGNIVAHITMLGDSVAMAYDAVGRLMKRSLPQVTRSTSSCEGLFDFPYGCDYELPLAGACINSDVERFAYDAGGNMVRAENRYARIARTYLPNGLMSQDSQAQRIAREPGATPCGGIEPGGVGTSFWSHVFQTVHTYDLAGREIEQLPALCSLAYSCGTTFTYSSATGLLDSLSNPVVGTARFSYDAAGRLTDITYPNGWVDARTYNMDSQVATRTVSGNSTTAISDALKYDAMGRILRGTLGVRNGTTFNQNVDTKYGPMGAVVSASGVATSTEGETTERFTLDAIGNRLARTAANIKPAGHADHNGYRLSFIDFARGRLDSVTAPALSSIDSSYLYRHLYSYDDAGNLVLERRTELDYETSLNVWDATAHVYDAAGRLRIVSRAVGPYANDETKPGLHSTREDYYYDALGRRIMTRSQMAGTCDQYTDYLCASALTHTGWDGDNIVAEIRTPADSTTSIGNMESLTPSSSATTGYPFGTITYLHAGGIDQPLAAMRYGMSGQDSPYIVFPHTNWRGQYEAGSRPTGATDDVLCTLGSSCVEITWPGARTTTEGVVAKAPSTPPAWFGSLITGGTDASGLIYQRNRYYDPPSGRFTQEDPIGLAGGMNAYGFGGGDRINFSDPMGLSPCCIPLPGVTEAIKRAADEGFKNSMMAQMEEMALNMPISGMTSVVGSLDDLARAAGALDRQGFTAAGRALTKHAAGQRASSRLFPRLSGSPADINRAAQDLVEDILTNPDSRSSAIKSGRFKGGTEYFDPSGRGVVFDAKGKFGGFRERP